MIISVKWNDKIPPSKLGSTPLNSRHMETLIVKVWCNKAEHIWTDWI